MKALPLLALFAASCAAPGDHAERADQDTDAHTSEGRNEVTDHASAIGALDATTHEEHAWLQSLVGTWSVTAEATIAPDTPPVSWTAEETVRAFGTHWVLAETHVGGPDPFASILTLGYDPDESTMVGSWIDTMQTRLWTYTGTLDANTLTLHAEGPSLTDPTQTTQYRDVLQLLSPTQRTFTSYAINPDGTWTPYMTATATRIP